MNCIDCLKTDLVFEGENEYEPDPETGEPRCFSCDLKANPEKDYIYWPNRYEKLDAFADKLHQILSGE